MLKVAGVGTSDDSVKCYHLSQLFRENSSDCIESPSKLHTKMYANT